METRLHRADSSTGIRIWSKASLLHYSRDRFTKEFLTRAPSGGFVQVTPSPAVLRLHSVQAHWHALGLNDDLEAQTAPRSPVPAWQHYVDLGSSAEGFLNFCNHIAWPLQHGLLEQLEETYSHFDIEELWRDFVLGSEIYAREMSRFALPGETQMLHDNHMWLVPGIYRKKYAKVSSQTPVGLFIHTSQALPILFEKFLGREKARQIIDSINAADCVTFQSDADMRNYEMCRQEFLTGGRFAELRATHVVIDPDDVEQVAGLRALPTDLISWEDNNETRTQRRQGRYGRRMVETAKSILGPGGKVIVGSMRLDPAKGVLELVQAMNVLINEHPEYLGRLHVILRTPESRKYDSYKSDVDNAIELLNQRYIIAARKHGVTTQLPLLRRYRTNSRGAAIGATRFADVCVYPSLADGYNISALEAVIATDAAAIVIGESAGVTRTLGGDALTCDPSDVEELSATLHIALSLSPSDRQNRLIRMRAIVQNSSKVQWVLARAREINRAFLRNRTAKDQVSENIHSSAS